jgi:hypothetical protein
MEAVFYCGCPQVLAQVLGKGVLFNPVTFYTSNEIFNYNKNALSPNYSNVVLNTLG